MLETMSEEQIEAVFGHEAGHIRHHHITFFVLFAILGTMIISGIMELLLRLSERGSIPLSLDEISVIGFFCMVIIWGFGFGWVSRRFEAQADLYGAQCASPQPDATCPRPCSVHRELGHNPSIHAEPAPSRPLGVRVGESTTAGSAARNRSATDLLCATGAEVFRSALEKVAVLNGIPLRERSWRHGSIAFRLHALARLAGDPEQTRRFNRLIHRLKWYLLLGFSLGLIILVTYVTLHPAYRAELQKPLELLNWRPSSDP
jgi:STE24 endopeptidase